MVLSIAKKVAKKGTSQSGTPVRHRFSRTGTVIKMKKVTLLPVILVVLLTLFGCSREKDKPKETLSSAGNIQNGGYVIEIDGEYYYDSQEDDCSLYKVSAEGKETKMTGGGHRF